MNHQNPAIGLSKAMQHETAYSNYMVPRILRMVTMSGFHVTPDIRILDFGCGSGQFVYDWRDAGFDAYGFDLHDTVQLRSDSDNRFFRINAVHPDSSVDFNIRDDDFRIDFEDGFFDIVISNQVLEHARNCERIFSELARVMKPQSIGFHVFPGAYRLVEPHMRVPLATQIQARWWFQLWAHLGIRNEHQTGRKAQDVAEMNYQYARTGLAYRRPGEFVQMARRHFNHVELTPEFWEFPGKKSRLLIASRLLRALYTAIGTVVLKTARY